MFQVIQQRRFQPNRKLVTVATRLEAELAVSAAGMAHYNMMDNCPCSIDSYTSGGLKAIEITEYHRNSERHTNYFAAEMM